METTIKELDALATAHPNLDFYFSNGRLCVGTASFFKALECVWCDSELPVGELWECESCEEAEGGD